MAINTGLFLMVVSFLATVYYIFRVIVTRKDLQRVKAYLKKVAMSAAASILATILVFSYIVLVVPKDIVKSSSTIYTVGVDAEYREGKLIVLDKDGESKYYEFPVIEELGIKKEELVGSKIEVAGFTVNAGVLVDLLQLEERYAIKLVEEGDTGG